MSKIEIKFPLKNDQLSQIIDNWWQAFADYESELNSAFTNGKDINPSILDFMQQIKTVSPDMYWEFSSGKEKPHRFTIAPERNYRLEPVARLLKERAPDFNYFEVGVHREATPWEWLQGKADSRFSWNDHDNIYVSHEIGRHNLIDLIFHIPRNKSDANQDANAFLLAELILGETVTADWVGFVDVEILKTKGLFKKKTVEPPTQAYPVKDLRHKIASEIARYKNNLPNAPFRQRTENMTWSIFDTSNTNPEGSYLGDMFVASFCDADLFQSLYAGRSRFNSQRFSALGESFIVVQIDGLSSGLNLKEISSRSAIEDLLVKRLDDTNTGAVIGGAMGENNAYIFLALENVDAGLEVIIDTLQGHKLGKKTWVLFCDTCRQYEWVGLWDDTPPPNLAER